MSEFSPRTTTPEHPDPTGYTVGESSSSELSFMPPVSELFLDTEKFKSEFGPEITTPEILAQLETHRELVITVNDTLDIAENHNDNLANLIESAALNPELAKKFFNGLAENLQNLDAKRSLLYFPFGILPEKDWHSGDPELDKNIHTFRASAKESWFDLLEQADVRASYVDGDILEADRRKNDPERIVKAAHIAPMLLDKGILSKTDILEVADQTKDYPILAQSFAGALDIMLDLGQITQEERDAIDIVYVEVTNTPEDANDITEARAKWLEARDHESDLVDWGEGRPILHGNLSKNLLEKDNSLSELESRLLDPELSGYIYPVAILSGSRLKGYGKEDSDLDISVFLRPDIDSATTNETQDFIDTKIGHDTFKFLLEKSDNLLKIKNPSKPSAHTIGSSRATYILFNGVWMGESDSIKSITSRLLPNYFTDNDERGMYMYDMERSALQYRLLHKGFARHYEVDSSLANLPHAGEVDGRAAFYDDRYRSLATRLFFEKVFLPKK